MTKKLFKSLSLFCLALLMLMTFSGIIAAANDNFLVIFMKDENTEYLNKPVARYATVFEPEAPTREGYVFGGWYTEPECVNKWDFNTRVPSKTILYPKWTPVGTSPAANENKTNGLEKPESLPGFSGLVGLIAIAGVAAIMYQKRK